MIDENYLDKKVKLKGKKVLENSNPQQLKDFRAMVSTKLVKTWGDPRDIKIAVLETLSEFARSEDLVGWIPGNEAVDAKPLIREMARLSGINAALEQRLKEIETREQRFSGLTFDGMWDVLSSKKMQIANLNSKMGETLVKVAEAFGDSELSLLHALWLIKTRSRRQLHP